MGLRVPFFSGASSDNVDLFFSSASSEKVTSRILLLDWFIVNFEAFSGLRRPMLCSAEMFLVSIFLVRASF